MHLKRNRTLRLTLTALLAALLCLAYGGTASAGVVWDVRSSANTTVAPGESLTLFAWTQNVGDVASDGSLISLDVRLPSGMVLRSVQSLPGSGPDWDCSGAVAGSSSFTCTSTDAAAANVFGPAGIPDVMFTADVDPSAAGVASVHYELTGGTTDPRDAVAAVVDDPTRVTSDLLGFGVDGFDGQVTDRAGATLTQAGGHPEAITTWIDLNRGNDPAHGGMWPYEPLKDVVVDLPAGFIGNPSGAETCTVEQLSNSNQFVGEPLCPTGSQVGTSVVAITYGLVGTSQLVGPLGVFNMEAPDDVPARFGFNLAGTVVTLDGRVRGSSDYGISIDVKNNPEALAIVGSYVTFWGVPADRSHDAVRSCPGNRPPSAGGPACDTEAPRVAFLRNPTSCTAPAGSPVQDGLVTRLWVDSWLNHGDRLPDGSPDPADPDWKRSQYVSHDAPGYPTSPADPLTPLGPNLLPTGCADVPFDPTLDADPVGGAALSSPTAFSFDLAVPQTDVPEAIAQGDVRRAVVTLPAGVRVSPSSAQGLAGCSSAQIALHSGLAPSCPEASKIGTVSIDTPLLKRPLSGSVYLGSPHDNPFNSLLSIYIVARGPGVVIKLPGRVSPDPKSGQLTTTFDDNPQLPFDRLHLEFKGGPRAPLVAPDLCGTYTTDAALTSWSGKTVTSTSTFNVSADGRGGACPTKRPFEPAFHAGTESPVAGASTPLQVRFSRGDRDEQLGDVTIETPPGVLGKIKNATLCKDADAAKAACGEASRIGSVTVGAGAGSNPFYITNGRAYITEGYGGGKFGMSIVVPAVAGPFDLGDVNVRAAIHVDRATAALRVVSDPMPTILEGIPLDVRDVRVNVDKRDFIVNPTSCTQKSVLATLRSTAGTTTTRSTRFQVGNCRNLDLKPSMAIAIGSRGRTGRGASTPFTTVIRQSPGQSNLRSVKVTLPTTVNARLNVVNRACSRAEFDAGNCEKARAGTAVAYTPLLADPLRGGAYFVRNRSRGLPDLMIALRGLVDIDLTGTVTIPGSKHLATEFRTIPDAPITRFELRLVAGAKGPVGAAANLCTARSRRTPASVTIVGQNGDVIRSSPRLKVRGCARRRAARRR